MHFSNHTETIQTPVKYKLQSTSPSESISLPIVSPCLSQPSLQSHSECLPTSSSSSLADGLSPITPEHPFAQLLDSPFQDAPISAYRSYSLRDTNQSLHLHSLSPPIVVLSSEADSRLQSPTITQSMVTKRARNTAPSSASQRLSRNLVKDVAAQRFGSISLLAGVTPNRGVSC